MASVATRAESVTRPNAVKPGISCRRMTEADIDAAVALLTRGFPERDRAYWQNALDRLRDRAVPEGCPRFGYVLTDAGALVGIALLIFSASPAGDILANVSSWYVDDTYRGFSNALLAPAFRLKNVTLFNVSPSPTTWATIAAQGFVRYVEGTFHALAWLGPRRRGVTVTQIAPYEDASDAARLAALGCLSYRVVSDRANWSFSFLPSRFFNKRLRCAQLVHCDDLGAFTRFAGPLGRRLLRHGMMTIALDANGPMPGLTGRYADERRVKYFRGAAAPPFNAQAESELVLFGL